MNNSTANRWVGVGGLFPSPANTGAVPPVCGKFTPPKAAVLYGPTGRPKTGKEMIGKFLKSLQRQLLSLRLAASEFVIGRPGQVLSRSA